MPWVESTLYVSLILSFLLYPHCCHHKILVTSSVGPALNVDNIWVRALGSPLAGLLLYCESLPCADELKHVWWLSSMKLFSLVLKELLDIVLFVSFPNTPYHVPSGCFFSPSSINYLMHIF